MLPFNLGKWNNFENSLSARLLENTVSVMTLFLWASMGLWEAMAPFLTMGSDLSSHITIERLQCCYAHQALTGFCTLCLLKLSLKWVHAHNVVL